MHRRIMQMKISNNNDISHKIYLLSPKTARINAPIKGDAKREIARNPPNDLPLFSAPAATTKDRANHNMKIIKNIKPPATFIYHLSHSHKI